MACSNRHFFALVSFVIVLAEAGLSRASGDAEPINGSAGSEGKGGPRCLRC